MSRSKRGYGQLQQRWILGLSKIKLRPRLWVFLLVSGLPFFVLSARYLELLERTGPLGSVVAAPIFSLLIVSYAVLVFLAKQRTLPPDRRMSGRRFRQV